MFTEMLTELRRMPGVLQTTGKIRGLALLAILLLTLMLALTSIIWKRYQPTIKKDRCCRQPMLPKPVDKKKE